MDENEVRPGLRNKQGDWDLGERSEADHGRN